MTILGRILLQVVVVSIALCFSVGAGRAADDLKVGSKDFAEQEILSEMIAILAEGNGIAVERRIPFGNSKVSLDGIKRGDIDIYVEYDGTGLVMLGLPPTSDATKALESVRRFYKPLDLVWGDPLGFNNTYDLVMRPEQAEKLGVSTISDLVKVSGDLTIGIESNFARRPLDGYDALKNRYGMSFRSTKKVAIAERRRLYDMLLDGEVDVIEGYTTDGQISDYNLVALRDDLDFFPVYNATPLYRQEVADQYPKLTAALDVLTGKIDVTAMREMNRKVELEGQSARDVAAKKLIELGLIDAKDILLGEEKELQVAISPYYIKNYYGRETLRAARRSFPGRTIKFLPTFDPLAAVSSYDARVALVSADAFFTIADGQATLKQAVEAVAAVGSTYVHALSLAGDVTDLTGCSRLFTGVANSASARVSRTLTRALNLNADIVAVDGDKISGVIDSIAAPGDCAVVVATIGDRDLVNAVDSRSDLNFLNIDGWINTSNPIIYRFLRTAQLPPATYRGQNSAITTLSEQLVLAAIGDDSNGATIGEHGPGSVTVKPKPLSAQTVKQLNKIIATGVDIDPTLPHAKSLIEVPIIAKATVEGPLDVSIVSLLLICFLIWVGWLLIRKEAR